MKVLAAIFCAVFSLHAAFAAEPTLDIYWIDVEGGASTLIVTPNKESVLIDSGWPWAPSAERIYAVATNAGLKQIDYLITTHFHVDHFGGAAGLSKLMPIKNIWDNGALDVDPDSPGPNGTRFSTADYRAISSTRKVIAPGDSVPLKTSKSRRLSLRCIAAHKKLAADLAGSANPRCAGAEPKPVDPSDNANSICLVLTYNGFKFFNGGDLTWNIESELVCPLDHVGNVDVYQVDHHGMDISNNPLLLQTLGPTVSVMDNGPHKGGSRKTVERLRATPSIKAMYQLHRDLRGDQPFNTENKYIANLEENCTANYIKCSVDQSGKTYTFSIPATGFSETYKSKPKHM
ncbi:MAG: Beta-lactamase domain protein [Verrucomicrobiales bacterium]|nr:Beta-lactamase domain protein [Verrucomicrobiales bacterium]